MKKIAFVLFISSFGLTSFAQAKKKSPVDGRIYAIMMTEEGKKKAEPFSDNMTFMPASKFKSNFMSQAQFPQAEYDYEVDSTTSPVSIKFSVESKNADEGRFSWEGSIEGDNISGTAIIRKKGKIIHTYTFTGTHKNKKKVKPAPKVVAAPVADSTSTKTDSTKTE